MNDTDTTRPMTLHLHVIMARFSVRHEKDGSLVLTADLPGVRDSLKVMIQGRTLTVSTAEVERTFTVGHEYDLDKIQTGYEDGVLTVTVPPAPARVITFREQAAGGQIWRRMGQSGSRDVTKAPDQIEAKNVPTGVNEDPLKITNEECAGHDHIGGLCIHTNG